MNAPAKHVRIDRRLPAALMLTISLLVTRPADAAKPDISAASARPDPASVQTYGPGYRYPRAGWIVLHVEGTPYDRGYQHGRLLAPEIVDYIKTLAGKRSHADPSAAWNAVRTTTNALFLRKYDPEFLEEMKGMADGATAAGATFDNRPLDLLDIVTVNSDIELEFLDSALDATATGLESRTFGTPPEICPAPAPPEHCSAFAATGPATADGKVVIGHITMFSLPFVRHFNVWLDVKPAKGHRVLMQTYPAGIQSGMDYYMNDAGLVVAETTIRQTKFDGNSEPLASRIRKALQYGDSIDGVVAALKAGNNGLYTNEWLIADTKTNEIAMFELGTHKSKLWRSSKDEWIGGTKGFYWGCNNAKDLDVRLETVASLDGKPANVVFHPTDRDRTWLRLYDKHKGRITADFGFEAFTTPPLSAFSSLDAKFTTSAMAGELKTWALFGPPLGRTWDPTDADRKRWPDVQPLVSNDWTVLTTEQPTAAPAKSPAVAARERNAAVDRTEMESKIQSLKQTRELQRQQVKRLREELSRFDENRAEPDGSTGRLDASTLETYRRLSEELTAVEVLRISAQARLEQLYKQKERLPDLGDDAHRKGAIDDAFHSEARVAAISSQKVKLEARLAQVKRLSRNEDDPAITQVGRQLKAVDDRLDELYQKLEPSLKQKVERLASDAAALGQSVSDAEGRVRTLKAQEETLTARLRSLRVAHKKNSETALKREFARRDLDRAEDVLDKVEDGLIALLDESRKPAANDAAATTVPPSNRAVDLLGALTRDNDRHDPRAPVGEHPVAWHGTLLPKADGDVWLAAAFADYEAIVARELTLKARAKASSRPLARSEKDELAVALFAPYSRYKTAVARLGHDVPLAETRSEITDDAWYQIAAGKGVLLLAALRDRVGPEAFQKFMDEFGRAHAGKAASTNDFRQAAGALPGLDPDSFFDSWLTAKGLPSGPAGGFWSIDSFESDLDRTVIVVGTLKESEAQREAGERLQRQIQRKWSNIAIPILLDRDATPEAVKGRHVLLVGRPETNSVTAKLAKDLPVTFGVASFVVRDETYAHEKSSVIAAGPRPDDPKSEVVVFAGLSAEATWRCVEAVAGRETHPAEVLILPAGGRPQRLTVGPNSDRTASR